MTDYKFNIDPGEPREEQIARHKNFGKVLQSYQRMTHPIYRTPLYRYRKILLAVFIVLIVVWLVAEFGENEKHDKEKNDSAREVPVLEHGTRGSGD